ncbi:uncharacterized protein NKAPD1 [Stegastes partitus]|uniref:NKAP domain containing 1 n=1 Tax=Stegastes partitus TaxID=144197 RepID=A0A3B5BL89_9TELE|nr:PREDICTED: uncharacterized protein C11orf57 homolog [Stegastes partitus]XP_008278860.1 PREDICTED: uncharacterized protein C11orf57 homolog [Stegastes partitus]
MAKQPLGKTLLRNVIRHTDAHNKIQEEMDMWKMRDWEIQMSHHKHLSDAECVRGRMHCDRVSDQPKDFSRSRERVSEHDDREARYWTRKLYDFEANDPDRWGHSGFKELYPEEFESDGEGSGATKKIGRHKIKKSKSDTEACLSKRSKKSSRKKKKKKKKKGEEEKRKKAESSSSDCSTDDSGATKDKQRRKRTKSRHKNKKSTKSRARDEDSGSGDSNDEVKRERRTRKKRKQDSHKDSDSGPNSKKKRRKDWKAAGEESSDVSSAD